MSNKQTYFERATSWAEDNRESEVRSRRIAWTVAGIAVAVAAFEAVALALLVPLKTVQPITLLVDRQTGYVQALDPLSPKRVSADDALTRSYLAQYVSAREGFDRATVSIDYRRVALWSTGAPRSAYLASMPATNPDSPFQRYPAGTMVRVAVKSVSVLSAGTALVRFDTQRQDRQRYIEPPRPWISVVHYRYVDAPMQFGDRLVNPLGFQVTSYARDAEAPPPIEQPVSSGPAPTYQRVPTTVPRRIRGDFNHLQPSTIMEEKALARARRLPPPLHNAVALPSSERREVPMNQIPLGSPLSQNRELTSIAPTEFRP